MDCHGKSQNCYRITNLTENRPYIFRIRSSDSNGDGEFSNEQTFYTNPKKPPTMEGKVLLITFMFHLGGLRDAVQAKRLLLQNR